MREIVIDQRNVDSAVRVAQGAGAIKDLVPTAISLGAAMEIAFGISRGKRRTEVDGWAEMNPCLHACLALVEGGTVLPPEDIYAARPQEFFTVRNASDVIGLHWNQFLERFSASLRSAGFGRLSHGIAGALGEMVDNIIQHSTFGSPQTGVNGVVGYALEGGKMEFAVGDNGIGALETLRSNPRWHNLRSSREAVHAIARQGASRRVGQGEGEGYRELFEALAGIDGHVRIRSGDGSFQLTGSLEQSTPVGANAPFVSGLQVSVSCRIK